MTDYDETLAESMLSPKCGKKYRQQREGEENRIRN